MMRIVLTTCLVVLAFLASAPSSSAIPLATYRDRVHQSVIALDSLQGISEDADYESRENQIAQTVVDVRTLLPPTENVEWNGSTIQVDNSWLDVMLTTYLEQTSSESDRKRLLTEATERLAALDNALGELVKSGSGNVGNTDKDVARAQLSSILRREEFAKKAAEGNALSRLWQRFVAWLRTIFPNAPEIDPGRAGFLSQLAQVLVFALAGGVIVYVLRKLWPRFRPWRSKGKTAKKREARIVLGERLEADQSSADLLAEAEALAREGNLRAAIRKGYIAFLCELGDRKVLGLAQHKTNRDYLRSVRNHEQLFREMQVLTTSFENHWYGFQPADMNDWNMFRSRYHQAIKQ